MVLWGAEDTPTHRRGRIWGVPSCSHPQLQLWSRGFPQFFFFKNIGGYNRRKRWERTVTWLELYPQCLGSLPNRSFCWTYSATILMYLITFLDALKETHPDLLWNLNSISNSVRPGAWLISHVRLIYGCCFIVNCVGPLQGNRNAVLAPKNLESKVHCRDVKGNGEECTLGCITCLVPF